MDEIKATGILENYINDDNTLSGNEWEFVWTGNGIACLTASDSAALRNDFVPMLSEEEVEAMNWWTLNKKKIIQNR